MNYRRHKYFLAVAQHMGFRRAANALHISQPALSQQMHLLEEELGISLFKRNSNAIQLTPAGEEYYKGVRATTADLDYWVKRARDAQAGRLGTLTVGANPAIIASVLPPLLLRFRKRWPEVKVRVAPTAAANIIEELLDRRIDIALTGNVQVDEEFESVALFSFPRRVALPHDCPQAQAEKVNLQELSGLTLFVPAHYETLIGYHDVLDICRTHRLKPGEIEEVPGDAPSLSISGLVACGLGFAIMSASTEQLKIPLVTFKPIAGHIQDVKLFACWPKGADNVLTAQFVKLCRDTGAAVRRSE